MSKTYAFICSIAFILLIASGVLLYKGEFRQKQPPARPLGGGTGEVVGGALKPLTGALKAKVIEAKKYKKEDLKRIEVTNEILDIANQVSKERGNIVIVSTGEIYQDILNSL